MSIINSLYNIINGLRDLRVEDSEKEKVSNLLEELDNVIWLVGNDRGDERDSDEGSDEQGDDASDVLYCSACKPEDSYGYRYVYPRGACEGFLQSVETGEKEDAGWCEDCGRLTCHFHFEVFSKRCTDCYDSITTQLDKELDDYMSHPSGCMCCKEFAPRDPVTDQEVFEDIPKPWTPPKGYPVSATWDDIARIVLVSETPQEKKNQRAKRFGAIVAPDAVTEVIQTRYEDNLAGIKVLSRETSNFSVPSADYDGDCMDIRPKVPRDGSNKTISHENGETEVTIKCQGDQNQTRLKIFCNAASRSGDEAPWDYDYRTLYPTLLDPHVSSNISEKELLDIHVQGSSNPQGNEDCPHPNEDQVINEDTMGGCGSGWESMCQKCGKVW